MPKIDQMHAWVAADDEGEGVIAHYNPQMGWMPLVGADMARMESLREIAQETADSTGKQVTLVRFEVRTDVETLEPNPEGSDKNVIVVDPKAQA